MGNEKYPQAQYTTLGRMRDNFQLEEPEKISERDVLQNVGPWVERLGAPAFWVKKCAQGKNVSIQKGSRNSAAGGERPEGAVRNEVEKVGWDQIVESSRIAYTVGLCKIQI